MEVGISIKGHRGTFGERPLERDLWRDTLQSSDTRLLDFFREV